MLNSFLNSLKSGAMYVEEDGVKSLYLDGSGAYATTPAVDLGTGTSFTIASWVKLQSTLESDPSILYTDWSTDGTKFVIYAYDNGKLLFGAHNNFGQYKPWFSAGYDSSF